MGGRYSLAEQLGRTAWPNGQHVALAIHGRSRLLAPLQPQAGLVCFVVPNSNLRPRLQISGVPVIGSIWIIFFYSFEWSP